jgi:hypothetical protein
MTEIILADDSLLRRVEEAFTGKIRVASAADWISSYSRIVEGKSSSALADIDIGKDLVVGAVLSDDPASADAKIILERIGIPVFIGAGATDLHAWLASTVLEKFHKFRIAATEERRASAILRSEYMQLQETFAGLESFVYELGSPLSFVALFFPETPNEVVTAEPSETAPFPEAGQYAFELRQPLPISLRGVSGVDLYLTRLPQKRQRGLRLSFESAGGEVGAIEIGWSDLSLGWNGLRLPRALSHVCADAFVVLRCELEQRDAAGFALGPPVAVRRLHLSTNGLCPPESILALRVYRGVPGVAVPAVYGSLPEGAAGTDRSTLLLPSQCPRPELQHAPEDREEFVQVDYWANENAIMIHGTTKGPVTAIIRDVKVENVIQVDASVNALHQDSPVLGFRLEVAPSGSVPGHDEVASHWTVLLPGQWGETRAALNKPFSGSLDFFMTVLVANNPGSSNWAWGLFRAFRLQSASDVPAH